MNESDFYLVNDMKECPSELSEKVKKWLTEPLKMIKTGTMIIIGMPYRNKFMENENEIYTYRK